MTPYTYTVKISKKALLKLAKRANQEKRSMAATLDVMLGV